MSLSFRAQRGIAIALKERPSIGMTERSLYMSGMSSMLGIALYRDAPADHEPK